MIDRREGMSFDRDRIENKEIPYRICKIICVLYSGNISEIGKGFLYVFLHIRQRYTEKILT